MALTACSSIPTFMILLIVLQCAQNATWNEQRSETCKLSREILCYSTYLQKMKFTS